MSFVKITSDECASGKKEYNGKSCHKTKELLWQLPLLWQIWTIQATYELFTNEYTRTYIHSFIHSFIQSFLDMHTHTMLHERTNCIFLHSSEWATKMSCFFEFIVVIVIVNYRQYHHQQTRWLNTKTTVTTKNGSNINKKVILHLAST